MKTTHQWLMTLPKCLRESAMCNTILEVADYKLEKLHHAVYYIDWKDTSEGLEFWAAFYECLKLAEGGK